MMNEFTVLLKNKVTDMEKIYKIKGDYPDQIKILIDKKMTGYKFMRILLQKKLP